MEENAEEVVLDILRIGPTDEAERVASLGFNSRTLHVGPARLFLEESRTKTACPKTKTHTLIFRMHPSSKSDSSRCTIHTQRRDPGM